MLLMPAQIKPKSFESRRNSFFFSFLHRVDVPHVYMCAWVLRCFHSPISTQTFGRVLTALMDINEREKCHFSGVAVLAEWGGRCWQSWEEGAGRVGRKVLAEWGGRCWKVMLGVWSSSSPSQGWFR